MEFSAIRGFRHLLGVLHRVPMEEGRRLYSEVRREEPGTGVTEHHGSISFYCCRNKAPQVQGLQQHTHWLCPSSVGQKREVAQLGSRPRLYKLDARCQEAVGRTHKLIHSCPWPDEVPCRTEAHLSAGSHHSRGATLSNQSPPPVLQVGPSISEPEPAALPLLLPGISLTLLGHLFDPRASSLHKP